MHYIMKNSGEVKITKTNLDPTTKDYRLWIQQFEEIYPIEGAIYAFIKSLIGKVNEQHIRKSLEILLGNQKSQYNKASLYDTREKSRRISLAKHTKTDPRKWNQNEDNKHQFFYYHKLFTETYFIYHNSELKELDTTMTEEWGKECVYEGFHIYADKETDENRVRKYLI